MIAAASRSTRARYASRCWRVGGPPERPRGIGPMRVSATWLVRRSSWSAIATSFASHVRTAPTQARVRAAYNPQSYDRLVALKNAYDPTNLFRLNQNIEPTV